MPTEFVYSKSGKFDFEIRWDAEEGRDAEIQIGIFTHHGEKTLAEALAPHYINTLVEEKSETPEQAAARKLEAFDHYRGIYGQFDRASLNRMIRLLRKARDHVYGRDE